jgi:hypothetical protein
MTSNRLRFIVEEKTGILNSIFYDGVIRTINPKTTAQIFLELSTRLFGEWKENVKKNHTVKRQNTYLKPESLI